MAAGDNLPTPRPLTVPSAVVWDFDWSLVNENSDTWIFQRLASPTTQALMGDAAVQWTQRCDRAALSLQLRDGVPAAAIAAAFSQLPIFPEHVQVVRELHAAGVRQFIVSDANTVFIKAFLEAHELSLCFSAVVSNTAWSQARAAAEMDAAQLLAHVPASNAGPPHDDAARDTSSSSAAAAAQASAPAGSCDGDDAAAPAILRIAAYHKHTCSMGQCPVNMCKGRIVRHELFDSRRNITSSTGTGTSTSNTSGDNHHDNHELADGSTLYATRTGWPAGPVAYVGDGTGDLCAAQALRGHDTLLVRRGFRLDKFLLRQRQQAQSASRPAARQTGEGGSGGGGDNGDNGIRTTPPHETETTECEQREPLLECAVRRWDGGEDLRQLLLAAVGLNVARITADRRP